MPYTRRKAEQPSPVTAGKSPARAALKPTNGNQAKLAAVNKGLAAERIAIPAGNRQALNRTLHTDASQLVVHGGPDAAEATKSLDARAFTVGRHVVLPSDVPPSPSHPTFLHEAIHARQQNFAEPPADLAGIGFTSSGGPEELAAASHAVSAVSNAPLAIARQPASTSPAPVMPPLSPSFSDVFKQFQQTSNLYAAAEKRRLALRALNLMVLAEHAREGGAALMDYFFSNGMTAEGERASKEVVDAWTLDHVRIGGAVPEPGLMRSGPPGTLQREAEAAARAGNHELAFRLFGSAFLLLSFQAADAATSREKATSTDAGKQIASTSRSMFFYPALRQVYNSMRDILGFYYVLAEEARGRGQMELAASLSGLALILYLDLRANSIWQSDPQMVAEVELVQTPRGEDALRIHGENHVTTDLTALPGLDPPREVTATGDPGSLTSQWQNAAELTDALHNQVELMVELKGTPEIQREFGTTDIDMNNLDHRLRIWKTMLAVYKNSSNFGSNGLSSLMSLIQRYLRAFTFHTSYNVDDFGQSYLADNMNTMPADLAGRLERDCGVYALTVAYEVFRTARAASPRLKLEFRVFTMPDHVTLVIDDKDNNEFYVVNNDQITPPRQGDPMREIAGQYAAIRKVKNLITPAIEMTLGDTSMTDAQFRSQAWDRYEDSASWGLDVPAGADRETTYREYYEAEKVYDAGLTGLERRLDTLRASLTGQNTAQQLTTIDASGTKIVEGAAALLRIFLLHGPVAPIATSRPDPALQRRLLPAKRFLFTNESAGRDHPLSRAAMMIDHWRTLGHTLDTLQQTYWNDFQLLGTRAPDLAGELARYLNRGGGSGF